MTDADDSQPAETPGADRGTLILLVVVTLIVRIGILIASPDTLVDDPDAYRAVALNLVEHGCFGHEDQPIATRPPLYPLVIAACRLVGPALSYSLAAAHLALGLATVVLTYRLAICWGLGRWAPLAAILVAVDPILLMQSTLVMTETLATFLAVAGLLATTRCARQPTAVHAALCGAIMAAAVLCRPTFLAWTAPALLLLPFFAQECLARARIFATAVLAAGVVLGPWMIRNAVHFGKPTPATNHGGFTLLLANNPSFYEYLRTAPPGRPWNADEFNRDWKTRSRELAPGDEVAADRLAYSDALATIQAQPTTFAYSCLVRFARTWSLLPHRTTADESPLRKVARWAVALFYTAESLLALVGLTALLRQGVPRNRLLHGWIWGLLLVASFTAVHTFYWTNMRMRAPLIPVACAAASLGYASIASRRRIHKPLNNNDLQVS